MMKKLVLIMMSLMTFTIIANAQQVQSTPEIKGIQEIKIKTSAVCDMCKETLEKAMAYEKGVKKSSLNVDSKILTVSYDPKKTNPEKIKKAITMAGYDADEMHANERAYENLNACCKKDFKH